MPLVILRIVPPALAEELEKTAQESARALAAAEEEAVKLRAQAGGAAQADAAREDRINCVGVGCTCGGET